MKSFLKQNLYHIFCVCIIIALSFQYANGQTTSKSPKKIVVVIDAGHGGKDSGAVGKKSKEKDIVLSIALKVGKYISENLQDVDVIYTRKTDVFIPLHKRAEIANKNKADLFISIHANSTKNMKVIGTETFAMGLHKTKGNLEVAQKENAVIVFEEDYSTKYEGFDPNSAESYIIFSLMQNTYLEQSLKFASLVQDEFTLRVKRYNRGVKQAGFLVLWNTTMPSVLIETGFTSNPTEEKYLLSQNGQDYLASAIYRAFKKYKNYLDELDKLNYNSNSLTENSNIVSDSVITDSIKNETDKIVFKIQISASSKQIPLNSDFLKGISDVKEYESDGIYRYLVGKEQNFKEIKKLKKEIKSSFPDAFIVAFKNGLRIPIKEAIEQTKN